MAHIYPFFFNYNLLKFVECSFISAPRSKKIRWCQTFFHYCISSKMNIHSVTCSKVQNLEVGLFFFISCIKVPLQFIQKKHSVNLCHIVRENKSPDAPDDASPGERCPTLWRRWKALLCTCAVRDLRNWNLPCCLLPYLLSERLNAKDADRAWRRDGAGRRRLAWAGGQWWSSMGKTKRVPRLSISWSRESSSRSSASSEVLPHLLPLELQTDPASATPPLPDAPLAVMAVSPNVKVRSPSLWRRSESWSLSSSWF